MNPNSKILHLLKNLLLFSPPFLLWIYLFRGFYPERLLLPRDGWQAYNYVNFYIHNIARGVFPLWNPFFALGRPNDLHLRTIGEFNPFFYLIVFFNHLGLSFSLSYFIFLICYYFLGLVGFYLLTKRIFNDKTTACLALVLLLFSFLGMVIFSSPVVLLLFVPMAWPRGRWC